MIFVLPFPPSWRFEITFFSSFVRIILFISLTRLASHLHICPPPVSPLPPICWSCLRWPPQPFGVFGWIQNMEMTKVPVRLSSLSVSGCRSSLLTMWPLCINGSSRIRNPQPSQNIIEVGKRVCWKYFRVNAHVCIYKYWNSMNTCQKIQNIYIGKTQIIILYIFRADKKHTVLSFTSTTQRDDTGC